MSTIPAGADARPGTGGVSPRPMAGRWSAAAGAGVLYGAVTVVLGVLVLAWPGATLVVALAIFAAHLFVHGFTQIAQVFRESTGSRRVMAAIGAGLSFLVGFLVLRQPLQTLEIVVILLGSWWVLEGVLDVVSAVGSRPPAWLWSVLGGVVSVAAGGFVLVEPTLSLLPLVWIMAWWMVIYGAASVVRSLGLRRAG